MRWIVKISPKTIRPRHALLLGLASLALSGCYTKLHTRAEVVRHHYGYVPPPAEADSLYSDSLSEGDSVEVQNKRTVVVHDYYHVPRPTTYWDFSLGFYSPHYRDYYGSYYWYDYPYYYSYPRHRHPNRYYGNGHHYHPPHDGSGGSIAPPSNPNYKSDKRLFNEPYPQDRPRRGERRQKQSQPAPKSSGSSSSSESSVDESNENNSRSAPDRPAQKGRRR